MSKEWKKISDIVDGTFIKVDSISDSFTAAYPEITHTVTIRAGNQEVSFETTNNLTVVNPKELVEEAQQQAWETGVKILRGPGSGGFTIAEMKEIFGKDYPIFDVWETPYKVIVEKIEDWKKRIKVRDVVVRKGTRSYIDSDEILVTKVVGDCIWGISKSGFTVANEKVDGFVKTGTCPGGLKDFFDEGKCEE